MFERMKAPSPVVISVLEMAVVSAVGRAVVPSPEPNSISSSFPSPLESREDMFADADDVADNDSDREKATGVYNEEENADADKDEDECNDILFFSPSIIIFPIYCIFTND